MFFLDRRFFFTRDAFQSTLLTNLAGVYSEVAAYEFTTLTTVPGVIRYKGAKIQLLDLPGIIEGAKDGKGRGKQVIAGRTPASEEEELPPRSIGRLFQLHELAI